MSNPLSNDLIAQFAKAAVGGDETKQDTTLRGTITRVATNEGDEGVLCVKIDGSDIETPVSRFPSTIEDFAEGDRVELTVKNHALTITGNTSNRAIGTVTKGALRSEISQTADEIKLLVKNTATDLQSSIKLNADGITSLSTRMGEAESSITQNAESITSVVKRVETNEGDIGTLETKIEQTASEITQTVTNNHNEFTQFQQTVKGWKFVDEDGQLIIDSGSLELTGVIKFSDLSDADDKQAEINAAREAGDNAQDAADTANDTLSDITTTEKRDGKTTTVLDGSMLDSDTLDYIDSIDTKAWAIDGILTDILVAGWKYDATTGTYTGKTYLDGNMIATETILANAIKLGGEMIVYETNAEDDITVGGYLGYCTGFDDSQAIGIKHSETAGQCLCGDEAARLSFGGLGSDKKINGSQVVTSYDGVYIAGHSEINFAITNNYLIVMDYKWFRPYSKNVTMNLGSSSAPWAAVYASTGTVSTSDRNQKNSIEDLPEKYIVLFDQLQPKRFKLNNGTSGRYHIGYIAQEVEEAMNAAGIDSQEFGGFVKDVDDEGNDIYLLRYGEFDAIRDAKIKQLEAKNLELEARIEALEKLLTQ